MSRTFGCLVPVAYFLVALLPVILKWAEAPRLVAWSWWKATALFWAPGGLLLVMALLGWLIELVQGPRPGRG